MVFKDQGWPSSLGWKEGRLGHQERGQLYRSGGQGQGPVGGV